MSELTVADVMTSGVETVGHNEELVLAQEIMSLGRIRHLPVLDDEGSLVGIVSQRDFYHSSLLQAMGYGTAAQHKIMKSILVKEVMHTGVETTSPDTPLRQAAQRMFERKVGCLPVLEGKSLVGILTESDFVRFFAEHRNQD